LEASEFFRRTKMTTSAAEEVMVKLPKTPKVVGHKILKKAEDLPRFEEVKMEACGTTPCSSMHSQAT